MKYIKELDSVRAIAVFLVIFCHWVKLNSLLTDARLGIIGSAGVDVFFVLSGFLITNILFEEKRKSELSGTSLKTVFKNFYARRALRIFPVFYLVVILLLIDSFYNKAITDIELIGSATYTINFMIHRAREWFDFTGHFWSLAVEEQFYLLWPLLILLVKRKYLPDLMIGFAATAITMQLIQNDEFGKVTTYSCFDAFAAGAGFSWLRCYRKELIPFFYRIVRLLAMGSSIIILLELIQGYTFYLPQRTLNSTIALYLIMTIVLRNDPVTKYPLRWLFGNKLLMWAGRVSYGAYIYHLYVPLIGNFILKKLTGHAYLREELGTDNIPLFLFNFLLLFGISSVSFLVIEQPILKLKRYFVSG